METQGEIEHREVELAAAIINCDVKMLDELLHEDLLFIGPTGQLITKEMDMAVYNAGQMQLEKSTASDQLIQLFGDTAIVSVTIVLKGVFMKKTIDGKFRYIRTWKKLQENWQVIGGACTPML